MPTLLSCAQGHQWQVEHEDLATAGSPAPCPVCGRPHLTVSLSASTAHLSSDLQAATFLPQSPVSDSSAALAALPTLGYEPAAEPLVELPTINGYEVLGVLGRGGMGIVYKARHVRLKRLVALKMILSGGQASLAEQTRFRVEAEAVARLQH